MSVSPVSRFKSPMLSMLIRDVWSIIPECRTIVYLFLPK